MTDRYKYMILMKFANSHVDRQGNNANTVKSFPHNKHKKLACAGLVNILHYRQPIWKFPNVLEALWQHHSGIYKNVKHKRKYWQLSSVKLRNDYAVISVLITKNYWTNLRCCMCKNCTETYDHHQWKPYKVTCTPCIGYNGLVPFDRGLPTAMDPANT